MKITAINYNLPDQMRLHTRRVSITAPQSVCVVISSSNVHSALPPKFERLFAVESCA